MKRKNFNPRRWPWSRLDFLLMMSMVGLWALATALGLIGNTTFIGHVSMLALVLAVLASWRSDEP